MLAATSVLALALVLREFLGLRLPLLQRSWQIPRTILGRFWWGSIIFGGILGVGILTYTPSILFFCYLALTIVFGSPLLGAFSGIAYAAGLNAAVIASAFAAEDPVDADLVTERISRGATLLAAVPLVAIVGAVALS